MTEQEYKHTPAMGEISGFGGTYEDGCQTMLDAGVKWLNDHPDAELKMSHNPGIIGLLNEDSEDAKELGKVIVAAADAQHPDGGVTGAMHQAVMSRLMFIERNGWDVYVSNLEGPTVLVEAPTDVPIVPKERTVWKFGLVTDRPIPPPTCTVMMPEGARILHGGQIDGYLFLWAEVNPNAEPEPRYFLIAGTGYRLPLGSTYLGTIRALPFIWHIYELPAEAMDEG